MSISRRDFLRASAAIVAARGLKESGVFALQQALTGAITVPVIWLQGLGCNGDSVSLLNTIYYASADELLLNTINLEYHPTVMAAAGELAVSVAEDTAAAGGYVLVVEGAIPTGADGAYCTIWEGMTMQNAATAAARVCRSLNMVVLPLLIHHRRSRGGKRGRSTRRAMRAMRDESRYERSGGNSRALLERLELRRIHTVVPRGRDVGWRDERCDDERQSTSSTCFIPVPSSSRIWICTRTAVGFGTTSSPRCVIVALVNAVPRKRIRAE